MLSALIPFSLQGAQTPKLESGGLSGYINMTVADPPPEFRYGVSLYSAAWPLLEKPIRDFQIGLASTWILPDNRDVTFPLVPHGTLARDSMPERGPSFWTVFQTIEGGLGFWASNRYFAPTAKFRMNGSVDGYNHEVSTPGWQFGGEPLAREWMGIAQLSAHVLVPPDGLTLDGKSRGELFGYAWMALPLTGRTEIPVATGDQSWTLFLNTKNFRGPVAFYLPAVWSHMSRTFAPAVGRGLDALPGLAQSGAIEVNTVPKFVSTASDGTAFTRIPRLQFPVDQLGQTVLIHKFAVYSKTALWNDVAAWNSGASEPTGEFAKAGMFVPTIRANPLSLRQGLAGSSAIDLRGWVHTAALDSETFGLQWTSPLSKAGGKTPSLAALPDYFRRSAGSVAAVSAKQVPIATGLVQAAFPAPDLTRSYLASDGGKGVWSKPGPVAGPFRTRLVDGSVVTYSWYRFVDQPSMQASGLEAAEKAALQRLVEKIHRHWTSDKTYMAPPDRGTLASLDRGLIVKPPKGLEYGFVPIAIRQDPGP